MKKMKARILVPVLALLLMISSVTTASAASCSNGTCKSSTSLYYQYSTSSTSTHKYGGVLGLFQKTCTVNTYKDIYSEICSSGHINGYLTITAESHSAYPDCQ